MASRLVLAVLACACAAVVHAGGQDGATEVTEIRVMSPSDVAGTYGSIEANFTRSFRPFNMGPFSLVMAVPEKGCSPLTNAAAVRGNAVMILRGDCPFLDKVSNAYAAGASAVIVADTVTSEAFIRIAAPISSVLPIPATYMRAADARSLKAVLDNGGKVTFTIPQTRMAWCTRSTASLQCAPGSVISIRQSSLTLSVSSVVGAVIQRILMTLCDGFSFCQIGASGCVGGAMVMDVPYDCVQVISPGTATPTDADADSRRCPLGLIYASDGNRAYCTVQPDLPQSAELEDYCDFIEEGYFGFRYTPATGSLAYDCPLGSSPTSDGEGSLYCVWTDLPGASHLRAECAVVLSGRTGYSWALVSQPTRMTTDGATCKLPFKAGNKWYTDCTTAPAAALNGTVGPLQGTEWCALSTVYDGRWGQCAPKTILTTSVAVDAAMVVNTTRGGAKAFFFQGSNYIQFDVATNRQEADYPRPILGNWPGLSFAYGIDAAVEWDDGDTVFFFKGNQFVAFSMLQNKQVGSPQPINNVTWPGLSFAVIDAALNWGNGKIYFFRGDSYVRFDVAKGAQDPSYPRKIAGGWSGLAFKRDIDAAVRWSTPMGDRAYFFKGTSYTRFDMATGFQDPNFPAAIDDHTWPDLCFAPDVNCGDEAIGIRFEARQPSSSLHATYSDAMVDLYRSAGQPENFCIRRVDTLSPFSSLAVCAATLSPVLYRITVRFYEPTPSLAEWRFRFSLGMDGGALVLLDGRAAAFQPYAVATRPNSFNGSAPINGVAARLSVGWHTLELFGLRTSAPDSHTAQFSRVVVGTVGPDNSVQVSSRTPFWRALTVGQLRDAIAPADASPLGKYRVWTRFRQNMQWIESGSLLVRGTLDAPIVRWAGSPPYAFAFRDVTGAVSFRSANGSFPGGTFTMKADEHPSDYYWATPPKAIAGLRRLEGWYRPSDTGSFVDIKGILVDDIGGDTRPPHLILFGSPVVVVHVGGAYVEPGFSAHDNVDGDITSAVTVSGSVNASVVDAYNLRYSVSDHAGNNVVETRVVVVDDPGACNGKTCDRFATCSDSVTGPTCTCLAGFVVSGGKCVDATAPMLTLIGPAAMVVVKGQPFEDPGASAMDPVDGDVSASVAVAGKVNVQVPGTYTLTYTAADLTGNAASAISRTVTVVDYEVCGNNFERPDGSLDGSGGCPRNSSCYGSAGTRVCLCVNGYARATANGECRDITAPVLVVQPMSVSVPMGASAIPVVVGATDNNDGDISSRVVRDPAVLPTNSVGSFLVTYSVQDAAGNSASATVVVIVTASNPCAQVTCHKSAVCSVRTSASSPPQAICTCVNGTRGNGFSSCADIDPPIFYIQGSDPLVWRISSQLTGFKDPNVHAYDSRDGDVTSRITAKLVLNRADLVVTYRCDDRAGNSANPLVRVYSIPPEVLDVLSRSGSSMPRALPMGAVRIVLDGVNPDQVTAKRGDLADLIWRIYTGPAKARRDASVSVVINWIDRYSGRSTPATDVVVTLPGVQPAVVAARLEKNKAAIEALCGGSVSKIEAGPRWSEASPFVNDTGHHSSPVRIFFFAIPIVIAVSVVAAVAAQRARARFRARNRALTLGGLGDAPPPYDIPLPKGPAPPTFDEVMGEDVVGTVAVAWEGPGGSMLAFQGPAGSVVSVASGQSQPPPYESDA